MSTGRKLIFVRIPVTSAEAEELQNSRNTASVLEKNSPAPPDLPEVILKLLYNRSNTDTCIDTSNSSAL